MNKIVKEPVCHMEVAATSFATAYADIAYAFCSAQCKERFLANPHLYIGFPGHKAPAQTGEKVMKHRRLLLSVPLDAMQAEQVKHALLEMMGIHEVCIEGDKLEIRFDLMQVTTEQIADKLTLIGADLGGGWTSALNLALINYLEECKIGNLEVDDKLRCH